MLWTGFTHSHLWSIIYSAPERYKVFTIAKRTGGRREIAQPSTELKIVQRAFVDLILKELPIHHSAKAYRGGMSIRDNAIVHAGTNPILKMDFKNFFPSIIEDDWRKYCFENPILSDADFEISKKILFRRPKFGRKLRLSIGAPSSPILSNVLMWKFDETLEKHLLEHEVAYSRYADDLTFSGPRLGHLYVVEKLVRRTLSEISYPDLKINSNKTKMITSKYGRKVTGLTLSNDGKITIGKFKKRNIRVMIDHYKKGKLSDPSVEKLHGLLCFAKSVEPEYVEGLIEKYGMKIVGELFSVSPKRKYNYKIL